jgi:hypothetical protein
MSRYPHLLSGLRGCIRAALSERPPLTQVNLLIAKSHHLALAALYAKRSHNPMIVEHTLDLSDLAYDCIAELFRRDENEKLVCISTYFGSYDLDAATDEDLLAMLRRLVFSAVNQGLFRIYSAYDPSLGKVLRNVKLAVHAFGTFSEVDHLGEHCIVPAVCDPSSHLPLVDLETLQRELSTRVSGSERIPEVLSALARYLREQSEFSREAPLLRVALAIRWLYSAKRIASGEDGTSGDQTVETDVLLAIRAACAETMRSIGTPYLDRERVSEDLLGLYARAIEAYLTGKFVRSDGVSIFETMRLFEPGLSRTGFNRKHRSRLEYLARQAQELFLKRMKES